MKCLKYISLCLIILLIVPFIKPLKTNANGSDLMTGDYYTSSESIPKTITKDGETYDLINIQTYSYNTSTGYRIRDYSRYDGWGNCSFVYDDNKLTYSFPFTINGQNFYAQLTEYYEVSQNITKYASPGYYLRGRNSYYNPWFECWSMIYEEPWCGGNGMSVGAVYLTAIHNMKCFYGATLYYGEYKRRIPNPEKVTIDLISWDYTEPNTNRRWIKVGNTATFHMQEYSNKNYSLYGYPSGFEYAFSKYDKNSFIKNNELTGVSNLTNTNIYSNGLSLYAAKSFQQEILGYKFLSTNLILKGIQDGNNYGYLGCATGYTLYNNQKRYYQDNSGNILYSTEKDGEYLFVDGEAPAGSMTYTFNDSTLQFTMNANVIDTGSGVKRVYTKIISNNPSAVRTIDLENYGGDLYKMSTTDLLSLFDDTTDKIKTVNVELWASDNVGNEAKISEVDNLDLFTLKASLERVLEPHDNNFKCKEQGLIVAYTRGYVDRVTMAFPDELMSLDNTLNTDIPINPTERKKNVPYKWFVPLYAEYKTYPVVVTAYRDGKSKSVTLQFNVQDTVLDKIRTAILIPDDDK